MNFATALRNNSIFTRTENGAVALSTTGDARLDLFGTIGSLRKADSTRICRLFAEAYRADPLFATKIAFYGRDVRGGLGERETFRTILRYMAQAHPEALVPNLDLIGVYGRYDDLYSLIGTPLETQMWAAMKAQFEADRQALQDGRAVSLLAKWIKTADASSEKTRALGILTAGKLGYDVYTFKRIVRALRRRIGVIETLMSAGRWDEIVYPDVPSRAMMIYRKAFQRHDAARFSQFITRAASGEEKIHAAALFPYDIVEKVMVSSSGTRFGYRMIEDPALEAQWRQLPDYVEPGTNALVIADTSGSMRGRPLATALGLAVYFAQRNKGAYHNMFMSFSHTSRVQILRGETLAQQLDSVNMSDWDMNTNLEAAFDHILEIAVRGRVAPEEMPKSLIVISDMEIDYCGGRDWTFYQNMAARFRQNGYSLPGIIFWNVDSRNDVFHADKNRIGVQLVSGQSASTFRQVMQNVGMTPVEAMEKTINAERYDAITVNT
ncbi:MAG: DUF2828 family protein [Eubacteriales bacterium]|nr:DUF2828 family protein [Eubacteriales bacterium]